MTSSTFAKIQIFLCICGFSLFSSCWGELVETIADTPDDSNLAKIIDIDLICNLTGPAQTTCEIKGKDNDGWTQQYPDNSVFEIMWDNPKFLEGAEPAQLPSCTLSGDKQRQVCDFPSGHLEPVTFLFRVVITGPGFESEGIDVATLPYSLDLFGVSTTAIGVYKTGGVDSGFQPQLLDPTKYQYGKLVAACANRHGHFMATKGFIYHVQNGKSHVFAGAPFDRTTLRDPDNKSMALRLRLNIKAMKCTKERVYFAYLPHGDSTIRATRTVIRVASLNKSGHMTSHFQVTRTAGLGWTALAVRGNKIALTFVKNSNRDIPFVTDIFFYDLQDKKLTQYPTIERDIRAIDFSADESLYGIILTDSKLGYVAHLTPWVTSKPFKFLFQASNSGTFHFTPKGHLLYLRGNTLLKSYNFKTQTSKVIGVSTSATYIYTDPAGNMFKRMLDQVRNPDGTVFFGKGERHVAISKVYQPEHVLHLTNVGDRSYFLEKLQGKILGTTSKDDPARHFEVVAGGRLPFYEGMDPRKLDFGSVAGLAAQPGNNSDLFVATYDSETLTNKIYRIENVGTLDAKVFLADVLPPSIRTITTFAINSQGALATAHKDGTVYIDGRMAWKCGGKEEGECSIHSMSFRKRRLYIAWALQTANQFSIGRGHLSAVRKKYSNNSYIEQFRCNRGNLIPISVAEDGERVYLLERNDPTRLDNNDRVIAFEGIHDGMRECPASRIKTIIPFKSVDRFQNIPAKYCISGSIEDTTSVSLMAADAAWERICRGPFDNMAVNANCGSGSGSISMAFGMNPGTTHRHPSKQVARLEMPCPVVD